MDGASARLEVRAAGGGDAAALVPLLAELGYPAAEDAIASRLRRVGRDGAHAWWVALDGAGTVLGTAAAHLVHGITSDEPAAQLVALVTARTARGRGVGSALCATFEAWAAGTGTTRLLLHSASDRVEAHAFYEHHGYRATGLRFSKTIPRPERGLRTEPAGGCGSPSA